MITNKLPQYSTIADFASRITHLIRISQWETCLSEIKSFVEAIVRNPYCNGILLDMPELDALCMALGHAIPDTASTKTEQTTDCLYLASHLYTTGGHTAVIEDLIRAQPTREHHILITNIYHAHFKKNILKRFAALPVQLHWSNQKRLLDKYEWVTECWRQLNPKSVFLFNHHQDSVAVTAATASMPGDLYYYHHTDFQVGLGKTLAHAIHIDMNPLTYAHCRHNHYQKHVYLPLTCHDYGTRDNAADSFMTHNLLRTASSGSSKKFTWPYPFSYLTMIADVLAITNGTHVHIGPLDHDALKHIHRSLSAKKIPHNRFIHIPKTNNLWKTILDERIDLFLTSFPVGGGRTAIEVMGSGTPIIGHANCISPHLSELSLLPNNTPYWESPVDLLSLLSSLSTHQLSELSIQNRQHYEQHYREDYLAKQIAADFCAITPPTIDLEHTVYKQKPLNIQELLLSISHYMANGENIEGRAIPSILLKQFKKHVPKMFDR